MHTVFFSTRRKNISLSAQLRAFNWSPWPCLHTAPWQHCANQKPVKSPLKKKKRAGGLGRPSLAHSMRRPLVRHVIFFPRRKDLLTSFFGPDRYDISPLHICVDVYCVAIISCMSTRADLWHHLTGLNKMKRALWS